MELSPSHDDESHNSPSSHASMSPGAGTPRNSKSPLDTKRDSSSMSSRSVKIQLNQQDANTPIPQLTLLKYRFLLVVVFGVGVVCVGLATFIEGIAIETDIGDWVGTSATADSRVELFQSVNGFLWAAIGLLLEEYFKIFIAVMLVFFANHKWSPSDRVTEGPTKLKLATLFWFTPLVMYVINIGLSSVYVVHKETIKARGFADGDLVSDGMSVTSLSTVADGRTSVVDTVLRSAVNGEALPFVLDPSTTCATANDEAEIESNRKVISLPKMTDLQGTSVAFGFTPRAWNLDAMPYSLTPKASIKFSRKNDTTSMETVFTEFMKQTALSYDTLIDIMIQGHTLHGKALSDSNAWAETDCLLNDDGIPTAAAMKMKMAPGARPKIRGHTPTAKLWQKAMPRKLQTSYANGSSTDSASDNNTPASESVPGSGSADPPENLAKCAGAGDYLDSVVLVPDPKDQTATTLLNSIMKDVNGILTANATIEIDVHEISPLIQVTMITIDIPFKENELYRVTVPFCTEDFRLNETMQDVIDLRKEYPNDEEFLELEEYLCSPNLLPYDIPRQQCGESNCVVEDFTDALQVNRQVSAVPFMTKCDPDKRFYDATMLSWMPQECVPQPNSLFLYGAGSYFTGNFEKRGGDRGPLITSPRRHHKLTFAKLDWKLEDLAARFGADCNVANGTCNGMIHALENVKTPEKPKPRVLIVGENRIPTDHVGRTLQNPLALVMLRDPKFYGLSRQVIYNAYEFMDIKLMNTTYTEDQTLGLSPGNCSMYIDAYLKQVEKNHFYIQDPRQAVYTSAVYYLFQNAAVKEVTLPSGNKGNVVDLSQPFIGNSRMKGDLEQKEIKYSIPLPSAVSTGIGIVMVLMFMGIIIKWPRDAVKGTDETNPAAQYADVLIDDLYPEKVHTRRLRLMDGTEVEMDDYATKRMIVRNHNVPGVPVIME